VPFTQRINSWAWEIVCKAAKRPSTLPLPTIDRYRTASKDSEARPAPKKSQN